VLLTYLMRLKKDIMANFKIDKKIVKWQVSKPREQAAKPALTEEIVVSDVKLPSDAPARMKTLRAEGKKWYLTVVSWPDTNRPFALFCQTNNKEPSVQTLQAVDELIALGRSYKVFDIHIDKTLAKINSDNNVSKLTRTISLLLRHNVPIVQIVAALDKLESVFAGSFLFQIKKHLSNYIEDGTVVSGITCSECGSTNIKYEGGCPTCLDCGHSKCG